MDDGQTGSGAVERRPLAEVLPGLAVHPLDEGEAAEEAFIVIKVRGKDGATYWSYRTTHRPNREELLGALTVQADLLRRDMVNDWEHS
ncbi:hypothetical protein WEI85_02400 [Actinomycetes bacterium KLBMP 9797]